MNRLKMKSEPMRRMIIFRWRSLGALAMAAALLLLGIWGLVKPLPNACIMTYMYPTYVPLPSSADAASGKYGLFLYHEGWKPIDFALHLRGISGVPVLFIPGNGGSYKQVRSLGAESDRAYNGGPMEESYYSESTFTPEESGLNSGKNWWGSNEGGETHAAHVRDLLESGEFPGAYVNRLDWFAVDLEGEHSALDGRILQEHTNYVVQAIHRILDQYKESANARSKSDKSSNDVLPRSVILVGHSMGGFVARAAVVHPELRKGAVETLITISSPHLLAPLALQPSLGQFFFKVNNLWKLGYEASGRSKQPALANVVVVSIPGGVNDYQVRSRMAALDRVIPATHSLTVAAPGLLNAWLSTEHQTILWCNQLVVQLSHTLLKLVDKNTGQAFKSPGKRLAVFISSLRSALPQTFDWLPAAQAENSQSLKSDRYSCPRSLRWETRERDLKVDASSVTVLAMDGRRRWLNVKKQASFGKTSFVLVTNLPPCIGVRIHLWPEKTGDSKEGVPVEVTTRMVQLPATPAPRQAEPGGQSEQAPPSGILKLAPGDLKGIHYITISVSPRPTYTGRPPQATSMAVGQFFHPEESSTSLSVWRHMFSLFWKQNIILEENHPLVLDFAGSVGFGVLPLSFDTQTVSCGIPDSTYYRHDTSESEISSLCKRRCFPPVALLWDPYAGLQVAPSLRSQTIISDSSSLLVGLKHGPQNPALLFLADPHCGYNITFEVAKSATINRFLLTHGSQIGGFLVAVLFFALMLQTRSWELDQPLPSIYSCLEANLMLPAPFIPFCLGPLFLYFIYVSLVGDVAPPFITSTVLTIVCYLLACGIITLIAVSSSILFHITTSIQLFFQSRWQPWSLNRWSQTFLQRVLAQLSACLNLEVVKRMRAMPRLTLGVMATVLAFFVHPVLGLALVLVSHTYSCHTSLCSYHRSRKSEEDDAQKNSGASQSHLESFKFFQAVLLLHFIAMAMLLPSFIAWVQKPKVSQTLPWLLDSTLSFGVILHGLYAANGGPESVYFHFLQFPVKHLGLSLVYGLGGVYSYWGGLLQAPYRAFYAIASLGFLTSVLRYRNNSSRCNTSNTNRRHFHRH